MPPPLILALGNPILTDDRVGLEVARALHARLPAGAADLVEASVGGLELLDLLAGRERVLLLDAIEPGRLAPGEVEEIALADLARSRAPLTPHDAGLLDCLALGRACGMAMPADVLVYAIGVADPYTFGERLTDAVAAAVPGIVERVHARVFGPHGRWGGAG